MAIDVPLDRNSIFKPHVVKKDRKIYPGIDQKIFISMHAKGIATRQISYTLMDIYGFEASERFIFDVTDKLLPQIEEWKYHPLDEVKPVSFIDGIRYSLHDNGIIRKFVAYVILEISLDRKK